MGLRSVGGRWVGSLVDATGTASKGNRTDRQQGDECRDDQAPAGGVVAVVGFPRVCNVLSASWREAVSWVWVVSM